MKTSERHQLKTNEVASTVARMSAWFTTRGSQLAWMAAVVVALAIVLGGFWAWRMNNQEQAGALLADAMSTAQMPVLPEATPDAPAPAPAAGTFANEQARNDAVIKKLQEIVARYPSTPAGKAARGELASLLLSMGKAQDAEQHFKVLSDERGIYGRTARLGLAEVQVRAGKYDAAIAIYRDLVTRKEEDLPTDALLMQLARAYKLAGKRTEARQTYQRVVSEFPESIYTADARQQVEQLDHISAS